MGVNWNDIAGQLVSEALRILVPVLIVLILKWVTEIYKTLKEKHPEIANLIAYAAQLGYAAAEEYFRGKKASGEEKMLYAIDRAYDYLNTVGVKADESVIRDSINRYGVVDYKFSWSRSSIADLFAEQVSEPESEEEENDESGDADDLCLGGDHDSDDADHNEAGEPAVRPDQEVAGCQAGERTPDDDQNGQAGETDTADGQTTA